MLSTNQPLHENNGNVHRNDEQKAQELEATFICDIEPNARDRIIANGLFFGNSISSRRLINNLLRFANAHFPVLLVGPTGVGKTALARLIHDSSPVADGPFVTCSVVGISDDLRHAELSGAARGAYTGAARDRRGFVEAASGGTLFIDELGHATLGMQQALLTILESRVVYRVGETQARPVRTRFVLASSVPPTCKSLGGELLDELVYRVEGLIVNVPPLSERRSEIVPLAVRFLTEAFSRQGRVEPTVLSKELAEALRNHPWPGNVRQLKYACERTALSVDHTEALGPCDFAIESDGQSLAAEDEAARVARVLARHGGNISRAARELGITRQRLYKLLEKKERS